MDPDDSKAEDEQTQPASGAGEISPDVVQNEAETVDTGTATAVNGEVVVPETAPAALPNQRPALVASLLVEGEVSDGWFLANRQHSRFFVLNLAKVLTDLNPNHTKLEAIFRAAERVIAEETEWPTQYRFEYRSSHTQIFPEKRFKAKLFGHAATIVVAMELIAADIDPNYNVYNHLRIVPATFFIDRFNRNQLMKLDDYYAKLSREERAEHFGELVADDFEQLALNAIHQPNSKRLLQQMAAGHTSTLWVCERLRDFVADHFPPELHLDITRASEDSDKADPEPGTTTLGVKGAAQALRVPRFRRPEELPPCR